MSDQPRLGLVSVPDGQGGTRLQMAPLPIPPAKGKKARKAPDPIEASAEGSAQKLKLFIERIERLEEEKTGIADDIRDVFSEMKAVGFDVKMSRKIIALRKLEKHDRDEMDAIFETYRAALNL